MDGESNVIQFSLRFGEKLPTALSGIEIDRLNRSEISQRSIYFSFDAFFFLRWGFRDEWILLSMDRSDEKSKDNASLSDEQLSFDWDVDLSLSSAAGQV